VSVPKTGHGGFVTAAGPAVLTAVRRSAYGVAERGGADSGRIPAIRHRARGVVAVPAATALLVGVHALQQAARRATVPAEGRIVDAAFAALHPVGPAPDGIGLDGISARVQLSAYAGATGAFERYPTVLGGARELSLLACAVLLGALVAFTRSLGVRPLAAAAGLGMLALCSPAVATLTTFGPGLLGAAWLAVGGALLARSRPWLQVLGVPAVLLGILTAPVLAVLVLVVSAAVLVAVRRRRRGTSLLGAAVVGAALPLALLPPPGGAAALPALVAVAVLVGLVVLDETIIGLSTSSRPLQWGGVVALVAVPVAALVVVLAPVPRAVSDAAGTVDGAPGLAAWLRETTNPDTGVAAAPGVWSDLLRAGVPVTRLQSDGALGVTAGDAGPTLARFGAGTGAVQVVGAPPAADSEGAGVALAGHRNLDAPEEVRAALRSGAVDPRAVTVLVGLADRGRIVVSDLPVLPGEGAAVPRHRVVLAELDAATRAWLAAQQPPFAPLVSAEATLTWPLPA
jgi:hypothetical protein